MQYAIFNLSDYYQFELEREKFLATLRGAVIRSFKDGDTFIIVYRPKAA